MPVCSSWFARQSYCFHCSPWDSSWAHNAIRARFGIRGVGSLYYLFFAVGQPIEYALATELVSIVLTVVACSIVVHGISATSLMRRYDGTVRVTDSGP
jgi:NhaP-type Na+/H+ or K+/H+ antiporter